MQNDDFENDNGATLNLISHMLLFRPLPLSLLTIQQFFTAHGQAVRYTIAKHTRTLLNEQEGIDIPSDQKLQDYALQYVLKEPSIHNVIVGCTHPSEVLENVEIAKKLDISSSGKTDKE